MRKSRVRPWVTVGVVVLVVVISGGIFMNALRNSPGVLSTPSSSSKATPKKLFAETVRQTQDIIDVAGGTWSNGTPTAINLIPWTNPPKNIFTVGGCGQSELYRYTVRLYAPGVTDPDGASLVMRKHWESLGFKVSQLGPEQADITHHRQLGVFLPDGAGLSFDVSTDGSGITVQSACVNHTSDELYAAALLAGTGHVS